MSLDNLIIKPATEAQAHQGVIQNATYWCSRAGIPVNDFVELSARLQQGAFAREGRLKSWVLVPEDDPDTIRFYASCQVLTREVLTLKPDQTTPSSSYGHDITFVIVPPEHRGKGYAKRFMSLLHSALAPHRYPNPLRAPTSGDRLSTVSVLYSAVGDYYSQCVPVEGESGWIIQKSLATTWLLTTIRISREISLHVEVLSKPDVTSVLDADDDIISVDLLNLQKMDPTKTYFAFVPTAPLNDYSLIISNLFLDVRGGCNPAWGAKISGSNDFMTWAFFGVPNLQLLVTRLRATTRSFPVLLNAALQVARDCKCESIEVWNVPEHLRGIARETGGETTERTDDLSAFKWYGQQPEANGDNGSIVWALDER